MNITCVVCPIGCSLTIEVLDESIINVTGNKCPRGKKYAIEEITNPTRMLTTTAKVNGEKIISVKSSKPLPKDKWKTYMEIINDLNLVSPINIGDIIIKNIDGNNTNIIATKNIN